MPNMEFGLRNIYPEYEGDFATHELTAPEESEQVKYDVEGNGTPIAKKQNGFVVVLVLFIATLFLLGKL